MSWQPGDDLEPRLWATAGRPTHQPIDWLSKPAKLGRPDMAEGQTPSTPAREAAGNAPGRHHLWPDFLVRWLFGRGDEERAPSAASGTVARFQNICISREAGAGAGAIARMVGKRMGG